MDRGSSTPLWKIVLGVAVGVLLADVVRVAWAMLALSAALGSWGLTLDKPGRITEVPAQMPAPPRVTGGQPVLHGPGTAQRLGLDRACINGAIAELRNGTWSQRLADGSVRGCRAESP